VSIAPTKPNREKNGRNLIDSAKPTDGAERAKNREGLMSLATNIKSGNNANLALYKVFQSGKLYSTIFVVSRTPLGTLAAAPRPCSAPTFRKQLSGWP
jgi:hypothetical protein